MGSVLKRTMKCQEKMSRIGEYSVMISSHLYWETHCTLQLCTVQYYEVKCCTALYSHVKYNTVQ